MHETAIALNVCCKDGSKLPLGRWSNEGVLLSSMEVAVAKAGPKKTYGQAGTSTCSK
jgi:predicted alpha/beta hydrolase